MRLMICTGLALLMAATEQPPQRVIDGTVDAREWHGALRHPPLRTADGIQRPHTELRTIVSATGLDILVYLADDDLRSDDRIELSIDVAAAVLRLDATPRNVSTPTGVCGAVGVDGSIDGGSRGADEEWIVEWHLPRSLWHDHPVAGSWSARRVDSGGPTLTGRGRF